MGSQSMARPSMSCWRPDSSFRIRDPPRSSPSVQLSPSSSRITSRQESGSRSSKSNSSRSPLRWWRTPIRLRSDVSNSYRTPRPGSLVSVTSVMWRSVRGHPLQHLVEQLDGPAEHVRLARIELREELLLGQDHGHPPVAAALEQLVHRLIGGCARLGEAQGPFPHDLSSRHGTPPCVDIRIPPGP